MTIGNHVRAFVIEKKTRLTRWILGHRIRARYPSLKADPTAIWDYGYRDIDAITIGERVSVAAFAEIIAYRHSPFSSVEGHLILEDGAVVSTGVNIRAAGGTIRLGRGSVLSQGCIAVAANHQIDSDTPHLGTEWDISRTGVDVGTNVWVGSNCVLLPGSRIGDNSVIAAGAVVRDRVPANELWGGVPAQRIRCLVDGS